MPKIFISYRRQDSIETVGRIDDRLAGHFGRQNVFKDVDSIPPAVDFREFLHEAVAGCDILLAVIGRDWLDICDESGNRRLDDQADFVRIEIEAALARNIPVVPVLVREARISPASKLPPSLKDLRGNGISGDDGLAGMRTLQEGFRRRLLEAYHELWPFRELQLT